MCKCDGRRGERRWTGKGSIHILLVAKWRPLVAVVVITAAKEGVRRIGIKEKNVKMCVYIYIYLCIYIKQDKIQQLHANMHIFMKKRRG